MFEGPCFDISPSRIEHRFRQQLAAIDKLHMKKTREHMQTSVRRRPAKGADRNPLYDGHDQHDPCTPVTKRPVKRQGSPPSKRQRISSPHDRAHRSHADHRGEEGKKTANKNGGVQAVVINSKFKEYGSLCLGGTTNQTSTPNETMMKQGLKKTDDEPYRQGGATEAQSG